MGQVDTLVAHHGPDLAAVVGVQRVFVAAVDVNYGQAYSCGTDTAQSVPCMFSGLGRSGFTNAKAEARENLLDIFEHAGIDVVWRENQAGCKGVYGKKRSAPRIRIRRFSLRDASPSFNQFRTVLRCKCSASAAS